MAVEVVTDASVVINSVDLSDHIKSVQVQKRHDRVDVTAMGDSARQKLPGLSDDKFVVEIFQDYAASSVDATLFPLVGDGTGFSVVVKPKSDAVSATNPSFTGTVHLYEYDGVNAEIGQASTMSLELDATGSITRATS